VAAVVPNEAEVRLLTDLLAGGTLEAWTLQLYKSATTPSETDTYAATPFTACDFTGYTEKTLTRSISGSTWSTPASGAPTGGWSGEAAVAESVYGASAQTWTCGATGNTVAGYTIRGATNAKFVCAELFGTARVLASGDVLNLSPRLGMA
jgi:hypothetical protein